MHPKNKNRFKNEMRRGVALLPNLLTTANMFCGFFSITKTLAGDFVFAVWLVVLAGLFDFLDGRVARMTHTQSRFGMEYDSLADLTTFCIAPAVLAYTWGLGQFGKIGLAAAFLYFACGALRLARFNVQSDSIEKTDFQGLPTPAAAGTMVSFVLFYDYVFGHFPKVDTLMSPPYLILLTLTVFLGALMVSQVRYKSMKSVKRRSSFVSLVLIVATLFIILAKPEIMLFAFGLCYISYGILNWVIASRSQASNILEFFQTFFVEQQEAVFEPQRHTRPRRFGHRHFHQRQGNVVNLPPIKNETGQE